MIIALVVGTVFFATNQLSVVLAGRATPLVWFKAALTYVTPLCVSSIGVLSATRRR
ncbi:MAG TPA: nitrate/nitrite transporter NrtS [Actinomycetota bacterium]|nr:nitrate/nitrite transporter NrtS [Actinomycetota bacterium]